LWAEVDVLHGAEKMRFVYENPAQAAIKGVKLKNSIENKFSWEVIGKTIIGELEKL